MATVKGQNLRLFIANQVVAMATTCSLRLQSIIREISNKDVEGGWTKNQVVGLSWSVSSDCVVGNDISYGITVDQLEGMVGQVFQVSFAQASGEHNADKGAMLMAGYAILNDVTVTAQNRQRGTCSITMTGVGRLGEPKYLADRSSYIFKTSDNYLLVV